MMLLVSRMGPGKILLEKCSWYKRSVHGSITARMHILPHTHTGYPIHVWALDLSYTYMGTHTVYKRMGQGWISFF